MSKIGYCFILITLFSCGKPPFFEKNVAIENSIWSIEKTVDFELSVKDTFGLYDFYVNIRNHGDYGYANLWLFITTKMPDGKLYADTIECMLADKSGRWYGNSSAGNIRDHRIMFKRGFRFPKYGNYELKVEQAMREKEIEGITDIGLRIEKTTN